MMVLVVVAVGRFVLLSKLHTSRSKVTLNGFHRTDSMAPTTLA